MSNRFVKVMVPPPVEAPRGARWLAALAVSIGRLLAPRRAGDSAVAVARVTRARAAAQKLGAESAA